MCSTEPYSSDDIKRKKRKNWNFFNTPLEDKINQITDSFEKLVFLLLRVLDILDSKFYELERRFDTLERKLAKNQINFIAPPSSPTPTITNEHPKNPRRAIMNELHYIFEKRNPNLDGNQKYKNRNIMSLPNKKSLIMKNTHGLYDATFKIIIFGDAGTGKVTLTQRFLTNLFVSDQTMTIGVDFEVKSLSVDGQKVKLQIWDFGGEERFRFLLPTYVRGARGGIFIYDITNYSSLAHIDDWLSVIRKEIKAEDIFPIIVVGNKAHLVNDREVPSAEAIKIAKSRGVSGFIEVSAKTGENVEKAFEALTRLMLGGYGPRTVGVKPEIIDEIGLEQVKESIQKYLNLKSKTNKQITRARTIKAIKKDLKLTEEDKSWDDDIWAYTISLSKSICKKITPKTIYFQLKNIKKKK